MTNQDFAIARIFVVFFFFAVETSCYSSLFPPSFIRPFSSLLVNPLPPPCPPLQVQHRPSQPFKLRKTIFLLALLPFRTFLPGVTLPYHHYRQTHVHIRHQLRGPSPRPSPPYPSPFVTPLPMSLIISRLSIPSDYIRVPCTTFSLFPPVSSVSTNGPSISSSSVGPYHCG